MNQIIRKENEPLPKSAATYDKTTVRSASHSFLLKRAAKNTLQWILFGIICTLLFAAVYSFLKGNLHITVKTVAILAECSLYSCLIIIFYQATSSFLFFHVEVAGGATRKQAMAFALLKLALASAVSVILFIVIGEISILIGSDVYANGLPVIFVINLHQFAIIFIIIFSLVIMKMNKIGLIILVLFTMTLIIAFAPFYSVLENKSLTPSVLLNGTFAGSPILLLILAVALAAAIKLMFVLTAKKEIRI